MAADMKENFQIVLPVLRLAPAIALIVNARWFGTRTPA